MRFLRISVLAILFITFFVFLNIIDVPEAKAQSSATDPACKITDVTKAVKMSIPIPGVTQKIGEDNYVKDLSCYIAGIYRYLAGVAGILATVMIIYGGIQYVVSFGNPTRLSGAKDTIVSAMLGLALVLGSYVILYFINPNLTNLSIPSLEPIEKIPQGTLVVVRLCDSERPEDHQPDGENVPCGYKQQISPDDPDPVKKTLACLGISCDSSLVPIIGKYSYCNVGGLMTTQPSLEPQWTTGNCISDQLIQGVSVDNPADVYTVYANTNIPGACGKLEKRIVGKGDLSVGTTCLTGTCVSYGVPPVEVDLGPLGLEGEAKNFECR
ncbi:MAG: pilin [Patescibacteria group bacterium]|jgi:hypothetical protein